MRYPFELLPPPPPQKFIQGIFCYITPKDLKYKLMLIYAYDAITYTNTWDFMKKDCESFMSLKEPEIIMIRNKIKEQTNIIDNDNTFGCIMRDMQYIAKYGEEKFMETYLRNSKE